MAVEQQRQCPTARRSWIFQASGVSQPASSVLPPLPPTSLIMRGRKLKDTLSSPNSHCTMAVERERGGKKNESGAKCERGLVSMPTAGGRTHATSQPGSLQDTCFCPSCFLSSPALPSSSLPSPLRALSISRGDKTGPCAWY